MIVETWLNVETYYTSTNTQKVITQQSIHHLIRYPFQLGKLYLLLLVFHFQTDFKLNALSYFISGAYIVIYMYMHVHVRMGSAG